MSDSYTSNGSSSSSYAAPATNTGTTTGATPNQPTPSSGGVPAGTPAGAGTPASGNGLPEGFDPSTLDLNQLPGFREHKSTMDKRIDMLTKQYQQTQQILQNEQRRAAYYEQELERMQLAGADETTILKNSVQKLNAQLQKERAERQQLNEYINHQRFLQTVKSEYGIELDEDVNDPQQAVIQLTGKQRDTINQLKQQIAELERKAGAIDAAAGERQPLGGGQPMPISGMQAEYNRAMLNLDGQTADRLVRRAAEEGVELDRYAWLKERKASY